ncbi:MAG: AI-2E family transporter [Acutalibacteraceae bacterium]
MKNNNFKKYFYAGVTLFSVLALCILLYFLLDKLPAIFSGVQILISAAKPLIYGACFAYILYPVCLFFEKNFQKCFKKMKKRKLANTLTRGISIFLSIVFGIGVVAFILYMIIPQLYDSILKIINSAPVYIERISNFVDSFFKDNEHIRTTVLNTINEYTSDITKLLTNWSSQIGLIVKSIGDGVLSIAIVTKNIFIGLIVAIYLLADRNQFKVALKRFIELIFSNKMSTTVKDEIRFANSIVLNFISGRLLDSAIIGILCYILMIILNLPFPLLIAVLVGVTNVIPFFGPFIGGIPAGLLILIEDPIKCLIFIVMIVILQQVDGNIIGPRILGDSIGLSSFWVLFSMLVFGGMFGLTGMIIGVPVFAIIYDIIKKLIIMFERKKALKNSAEIKK